MKKILFSIFAAVMAIGFVGCEYDDSEIVGRVENLEQRVLTLEQLCQQMNTNITAMQAIINALQTQDYITAVTPITQGSKTVGYTITFAKGDPITIYHGQDGKDGADGEDGKDGYTPVIGVDQDEDGKYYWTLDGEWMTDKEGNKIPATGKDGQDGKDGADGKDGENGKDGADGKDGNDGKDGQDGKDGITPQLDIRSGYWYISYDNGVSWERLGRATGYDGQDGQDGQDGAAGAKGDSMFKSVDASHNEYVIFTLSDNTEIKVPKWVELTVTMNPIGTNEPYNGQQVQTMFTINDKDADYVVICDCPNINVGNDVSNITEGVITITIPNDAKAGDVIKVSVLATKNGLTAIGTTEYEVLPTDENYIKNFTAGKLVLNQDVTLSDLITIPAGNQVELDLNGYTLEFTPQTGYPGIKNVGELEIKNGKITSTQVGIQNNGKLVINCDIESVGIAINNVYDGETTINGGTYKNTSTENALIYSDSHTNAPNTTVYPKLTINGGTFESAFTNVSYNNNSSGAVNAGTFICTGNWHNIYVGGSEGGCNVTYNVSSCSFTDGTNAKIQVNNGVGLGSNTIARTNIVNGTTYTTTVNLLD